MTFEDTMKDRRDEDRAAGGGPFPDRQSRERPWEAAETERGPFERRRGPDRRHPDLSAAEAEATAESGSAAEESDRRRRWGRRKADVLVQDGPGTLTARGKVLARRFREPLIGLTLAGVAAPLINAGVNAPASPAEAETEASASAASASADAASAAEASDLDEAVGDYWAEAEAEVVREATIEGAMTRFGIDRKLAQQIFEAADKYDIEPDMAFGLVNTESTFRDRAVSHVGARGLTQVMPRTAQWLDPNVRVSDLFNRDTNLDLGFRYLRQLLEKYDGDVETALTAYNRGPGTVDRILRRGGNPDNGYAGKVLGG